MSKKLRTYKAFVAGGWGGPLFSLHGFLGKDQYRWDPTTPFSLHGFLSKDQYRWDPTTPFSWGYPMHRKIWTEIKALFKKPRNLCSSDFYHSSAKLADAIYYAGVLSSPWYESRVEIYECEASGAMHEGADKVGSSRLKIVRPIGPYVSLREMWNKGILVEPNP